VIPLDDARRRVFDDIKPLPIVEVPLRDARGLVLAETVAATEAIPPFANTAMDGFAIRSADLDGATPDTPVELPIVATVAPSAEASVSSTITTARPWP